MENESEPVDGHDDPTGSSGDTPLACNSCRRRKLRCSRETPSCQQCRKTGSECVYETKRAKPGMKAGAIDNLHRRLDALERVVHQKAPHPTQPTPSASSSEHELNESTNNVLFFFAKQLQQFNQGLGTRLDIPSQYTRDQDGESPSKRRRLDDTAFPPQPGRLDDKPPILQGSDLDVLLQAYFVNIHPWIPMLHEGRLRRRLSNHHEWTKTHIILQAMVLVAAKHIEDATIADRLVKTGRQEQQWRDWIVANAIKHMSVENLQALIMIAYDDIGSGRGDQAWSIVGSMTRIVEYLQLTVENDETDRISLAQPYVSLRPPEDWTEAEERRRIFWNVFNLDRFCSVTMGWNTSLTSDDVTRRLPCDGITWRKEDPVVTPYFGIWDKVSGRIGNPLAFLPSHYTAAPPRPTQAVDDDAETASEAATSPGAAGGSVNMSTVGAFAYSIEATESLSRITTYFLQQKVNMWDQRDLSRWLTRFKELDLRLVHWKLLLPQKWKVDMARQSSRMDPNLTLAHVTHNASMILLHQPIAFPNPEWPFNNRLPSLCSADTCEAAAVEIATIVENFLKYAPPSVPVQSQFAFCLYIASRVLLLSSRAKCDTAVAPQFWSLLRSLDFIARRWAGPHELCSSLEQTNLAAKYSSKLKKLHSEAQKTQLPMLRPSGYTTEIDHTAHHPEATPAVVIDVDERPAPNGSGAQIEATSPSTQAAQFPHARGRPAAVNKPPSIFNGTGMPFPAQPAPGGLATAPLPMPLAPSVATPRPQGYHRPSFGGSDLGAISQVLLDQQFMDMDRIITYDDGMFGSDFDTGAW